MLVEKAYAKLNGSYANIIGGHENEALQDLTSGVPLDITVHPPEKRLERWQGTAGETALWKYLESVIEGGTSHLGCSKKRGRDHSNRSSKIIEGHAYGILAVAEVESDSPYKRIIRIRNPWGGGKEWDGAYGDHDPYWQTIDAETKARLKYKDEDDGTW